MSFVSFQSCLVDFFLHVLIFVQKTFCDLFLLFFFVCLFVCFRLFFGGGGMVRKREERWKGRLMHGL